MILQFERLTVQAMNIHEQYAEISSESEPDELENDKLPKKKASKKTFLLI